jgi:nicotinamidase-related amidase
MQMASIREGNQAAVIVIDMQNDVLSEAWERDGVISRTADLVGRARRDDVPVIFIQHEDDAMPAGSEAWKIVPELTPADGEPVIAKRYADSFEETTLEALLANLGVSHLVVAGAQTDFCIRNTTHRALAEGYDVTLVDDCHTTDDVRYGNVDISAEQLVNHTNLHLRSLTYPGRVSGTAPHHSVSFPTPAGRQEDS